MIIIWSPQAKVDYWKNIEYLESEWSEKEVFSFIDNVDYHLNLLQAGNVYFLSTYYKDVYKVVVVKQISLFYRIQNNKIELLRFWNNYQDLDSFKLQ